MTRIFLTTVEARDNFAELIDRAALSAERIVVTRHGEPMAALISLEDLELIEEVERRIERRQLRQRAALPPRRAGEATAAEQMRIWSGDA
jgi:prevent-host-death family protein